MGTCTRVGVAVLALLALCAAPLQARVDDSSTESPFTDRSPDTTTSSRGKILVLDGNYVHDVGQLLLNITNWGLLGSQPTSNTPYSHAPSAEWPAGSGIEHLFAAGLWVGAMVDGVPHVTTGQYSPELLPDFDDPLDTIYRSREGQPTGLRYPDPGYDDDGDGAEDEDPKNGRDDDGDGSIDEDHAAASTQQFRCVMRDDTGQLDETLPDHAPLGIEVVQETYQWDLPGVEDFVGFRYTITNVGDKVLEDVYLGMFADSDVGNRNDPNMAVDDVVGALRINVPGPFGSIYPLSIGIARDAIAPTTHLGVVFIAHDLDPTGAVAPDQVGFTGFQAFAGSQPYALGGDPTNDAERYDALSSQEFESSGQIPDDWRMLASVGPFRDRLGPGQSLVLDGAFVAGAALSDLAENAAMATYVGVGQFFDRDGDAGTGLEGREYRVPWLYFDPSVSNGDDDEPSKPREPRLSLSAAPNPFNPRVRIEYELPRGGTMELSIYDAQGRRVRTLVSGEARSGSDFVIWDGTDATGRPAASGVYFLRLNGDGRSVSERIVLVR